MPPIETTPQSKSILIIGLGNPILGDDGVGWRVVESLQTELASNPSLKVLQLGVDIDYASTGGLGLMELLEGYSYAILVDAMTTSLKTPGSVQVLRLEELPNRTLGHLGSSHDTTLQNAIEMGRKMGINLPNQIDIIAIEARNVFEFSENLSSSVEQSIPVAVKETLKLVKQYSETSRTRLPLGG